MRSDVTHKYFYEKTAFNLISDPGQIHHRIGDMYIRDRVVSRGGYLGFRLDRVAESTGEAVDTSQVADLLGEIL